MVLHSTERIFPVTVTLPMPSLRSRTLATDALYDICCLSGVEMSMSCLVTEHLLPRLIWILSFQILV